MIKELKAPYKQGQLLTVTDCFGKPFICTFLKMDRRVALIEIKGSTTATELKNLKRLK